MTKPFIFPDPGVPRIPIERIDDIHSEQAARAVAESRPFVARFPGAVLDWTPAYLREKGGAAPIETWKKSGEKAQMSLAAFLDLVDKPEEHARDYVVHNYPVIKLWDWSGPNAQHAALLADVNLPAFIERDRIAGMFVWVRNTGYYDNKSHCESNACAAINLQVRGKKHVWLFPPDDASRLGVHVPRDQLMEPAFFSTEQTVYHPSQNPTFADAHCYEAVLEPGDAIHIPTFWFHWFVHYDVYQMNLNCWFSPHVIPLSPIAANWAYMNALTIALGDLTNLKQQFEELPLATQELLTRIADILVDDPRCTSSMRVRELNAARAKQVLDPKRFTKKP
jgi:hypothetical protein